VIPVTTLQSIGSVIPQPGSSKPGGAGILQTQLSRYEAQLADWCNCPSGKTPEGKQKIADLQQKADSVKAQIKQIDAASDRRGIASTQKAGEQQPYAGGVSTSVGSRLDVYA
jgi:hypothetical protein